MSKGHNTVFNNLDSFIQCCRFGMFIPDPIFFHSGFKVKKILNSGLNSWKYDPVYSSWIQISDPELDYLLIPDLRVTNSLDPGSGSPIRILILNSVNFYVFFRRQQRGDCLSRGVSLLRLGVVHYTDHSAFEHVWREGRLSPLPLFRSFRTLRPLLYWGGKRATSDAVAGSGRDPAGGFSHWEESAAYQGKFRPGAFRGDYEQHSAWAKHGEQPLLLNFRIETENWSRVKEFCYFFDIFCYFFCYFRI